MSNLETGQRNLEKGQKELESGQKDLIGRTSNLETGQKGLKSGQHELKQIADAIRDRQDETDAKVNATQSNLTNSRKEMNQQFDGIGRHFRLIDADFEHIDHKLKEHDRELQDMKS